MRFSAEWFKKLFSFASKREETSLTDEAGSSHEKMVAEAEAEEVIEKPSLRKRLMGLFRRGKIGPSVEGESTWQDEPQAEPETKTQSGTEAAAPIDEAGDDGGEAEALPRPGIFARLIGIFRLRKKVSEAEAGEEDAGQVAEKKGDEPPGTEEVPQKKLWARLSAVFKRKSSGQSAADLADAGELFSWGEGQAAAPVEEKSAKIEKGKKDEKGDAKTTDKKDSLEDEEPTPPGFGTRISTLIRKKKVWIPLLLVIIGTVVFAVSLTLYQLRTREYARMLALEKKNKQLQEENKKLQATKKQTVAQPSKVPAAPSQNNQADGSGTSAAQDSTDDCTVKNKASAAEILKKCIDNFNATDRH